MKIYIAAPWTEKAEAARVAGLLESAGHSITKKWWEHREVPSYLTGFEGEDFGELTQQAVEDISGVERADVFLLLNSSQSEGKAVETGIAIQCDWILRVLVGKRSNLFHYFPGWSIFDFAENAVRFINGL